MSKFKNLRVWCRSKDLAVYIYSVSSNKKFNKDFGLRSQIQRASVSIPSNIAEGEMSGSNPMSIRYFHIAKGSAAELVSQAIIAAEIGYIEQENLKHIEDEAAYIQASLNKIIKVRKLKN